MGIKSIQTNISKLILKYKYPLIILAVGIVLLTVPSLFEKQGSGKEYSQTVEVVKPDICREIEEILSTVSGVGNVRVMLSIAAGERNIYQTDDRVTQNADNTSTQTTTIITTNSDRVQNGLLKQVIPQTYRGAIVVCEGADSPTVRLAVIEAVCKITGLNSNQISVMKLK